jgi:hypothetical protein
MLKRKSLAFEALETRYMLSSDPPQITFLGANNEEMIFDPTDYVAGLGEAEEAILVEEATLELFLTTATNPPSYVTGT